MAESPQKNIQDILASLTGQIEEKKSALTNTTLAQQIAARDAEIRAAEINGDAQRLAHARHAQGIAQGQRAAELAKMEPELTD